MRDDQVMFSIDCDLHIVSDHAGAAAAVEAGVDLSKIDPEKLMAFLKRQSASGHVA